MTAVRRAGIAVLALVVSTAVVRAPAAGAQEPTARRALPDSFDFVVAKDGSGNFRTIQEAVNAVRDYTPIPRAIESFVEGIETINAQSQALLYGVAVLVRTRPESLEDFKKVAGMFDIELLVKAVMNHFFGR